MCQPLQGLLFWLFERGFTVSSGTSKWYRNSSGTDLDRIIGLLLLQETGFLSIPLERGLGPGEDALVTARQDRLEEDQRRII